MNIPKVLVYCVSSSAVGALVRVGHMYSDGEKIVAAKLLIPAIVGAATMFLGIVTNATKPDEATTPPKG